MVSLNPPSPPARRQPLSRCAPLRATLAFLGAVGAVGLGQTPTGPPPAAVARPNVVMFFIDDLNCRLGCYGDPVARTPHIDALARRGMRFDRAYCQNPVCLPSRTAVITGLRPETTGVFNNSAGTIRDNYAKAVTLPQFFRRHGYLVASVGKTFYSHGFDDPEAEKDVHQLPLQPGRRLVGYGAANLAIDPATKARLTSQLSPGRATFWGPLDCDDTETRDGQFAVAAARFLRERPSRPFLLAVGLQRPHLPFVAPRKYFAAYAPETLPLPPVAAADRVGAPVVDIDIDYAVSQLERGPTGGPLRVGESVHRRMLQAYYAAVSFTDALCGLVLQALRDAQLEEDTIVVFLSDNGFLLGEHGRWAKSWLYEESVRVPLIVAAPTGRAHPGSATPGLVEFVDLYPTLAELCSLPAPRGLDGDSFAPLLLDPTRPGKRAACSVTLAGERMVCTTRWKLVLHPAGVTPRGLLFDLDRDPREDTNLFASPGHQALMAELTGLMPDRLRNLTALPATPPRTPRRGARP